MLIGVGVHTSCPGGKILIVRHVLVRVVAEGIGAVLGAVVVSIVGSIVMDVVVVERILETSVSLFEMRESSSS